MHVPNSFYGRVSNVHAKKTLPKIKEGQQQQQQHVSVRDACCIARARERERGDEQNRSGSFTRTRIAKVTLFGRAAGWKSNQEKAFSAPQKDINATQKRRQTPLFQRAQRLIRTPLAFDWGHFCSPHIARLRGARLK